MALLLMLVWLTELIGASFVLSYGADSLADSLGARFVGRTVLSIATTFPEIAIVAQAARIGNYGTALGSALGSNILMMSLGLALMVVVATSRLSRRPIAYIDVEHYRMDLLFLVGTALLGVLLFLDGYDLLDGILFLAMFVGYVIFAFSESRRERVESAHEKVPSKRSLWASFLYVGVGGVGIFIGAGPFVSALEDFALSVAIPVAIVAVILSPLAGEMPEKISVVLLARQGERGAILSVGNVLGSKVLNNTLLLSVMILVTNISAGAGARISAEGLLSFEVYWTAIMTLLAVSLMFDRRLTPRDGLMLAALYTVSMGLQFILPLTLI